METVDDKSESEDSLPSKVPLLISSKPTDEWEVATQIYLSTKARYTTYLFGARLALLLFCILIAISIGIVFPQKMVFDAHPTSVKYENSSTSLILHVNITSTMQNPNLFAILIKFVHAELYYGPLWVGRKVISNLNIAINAKSNVTVETTLDMEINGTQIMDDVVDPQYKPLFQLMLNAFASDIAGGHLTLNVEAHILVEVIGMTVPITENFQESISWKGDKASPDDFYSPNELPDKRYYYLDSDDNRIGNSPTKKRASPPGPVLWPVENAPYWFYISFGTLIFIFILMGVGMALSYLLGYYYDKKMQVADQIKIKAHQNLNRLDMKPTASLKTTYDISFSKLGLTVNDKVVLESVSGSFASGRLTAIMGPSGCGKTSMLSVLSGRANYGKTTGTVFINGLKSQISKFKKVVGFVPQEDIMIRVLTVEEILEYSSRTRVSSTYSLKESNTLVEEVIQLLSLELIRDSIIGDEDVRGISGGQRKRVNIAMELVANPGMLFLDEPTSGLDSTSSIEVCQVLRKLAHNAGLTIVAVIHQPRYEIFEMFDDIALLGIGGRPVYLGPTEKVASYFKKKLGYTCPPRLNPADFYLDVISGLHNNPKIVPNELQISSTWPELSVCQKLQHIWEFHNNIKLQDNQLFFPDSATQELHNLLDPSPPRRRESFWPEFILFFFACGLCPWFIIVFQISSWRRKSVQAQFGGIIGISLLLLIVTLQSFLVSMKDTIITTTLLLLIVFALASLFTCTAMYYLYVYQYNHREPTYLRLLLLGFLYGPFSILIGWLMLKGNRKFTSALYVGALFFLLACVIATPITLMYTIPQNTEVVIFIFTNLGLIIIAKIITYTYRYINVAVGERETRGLIYQSLMATKREFIVQIRNWKEILFHLSQITFGGLFLGFIFYDRPYKGPVFSFLDNSSTCPLDIFDLDILKSFCIFLELPADDPIVAISSLSTLTVALCAVSYSIPIFGKEITVFKRETSTGGNTGAYYIGKSLAHLPMNLFAPVCFMLSFGGLAVLKENWGIHYIILTITYATFTGVGYFVSLATPPRVSQLAGIFFVLVSMMFSGGQPTLSQLRQNSLLGMALYIPSYLSYTRWANEQVYLIEIQHYTNNFVSMSTLYGYDINDSVLCWCVMGTFVFVFRILGYIALVISEHK